MKWRFVLFLLLTMPGAILPGSAGTLAQFRTVFGDIEVELYDQDKPVTVQNFLRYVQSGRYQDSIFHRCPVGGASGVSDFVVQGGGIAVTDRGTTNAALAYLPTFPNITNEFGVGRRFSNTYGTIAMAKLGGDTNSASSQWFFNLNDNSFLDAPNANSFFVVFGRVVGGTNVLNQFKGRQFGKGVVNAGVGVLAELPVNYIGTRAPTLNDLFYVDISLLNVQVRALTEGTREISWNSVSNRANLVEFTETFPPVWNSLVTTNGNGTTLRVTDTNQGSASRFYRVRVEYPGTP